MKAKPFRIISAVCCFLLCASLVMPTGASAASQSEMRTTFENSFSGEIQSVYYNDYDGNGEYEAFIIAESAGDAAKRDLYFINSSLQISRLASGLEEDVTFSMISFSDATVFSVNEPTTYTTQQTLYRVSGSSASAIFTGYDITLLGGNDFTSVDDTYDAVKKNSSGSRFAHSNKVYYFYYNNGKISQYSAKKIKQSRFLKYKNSKKYLKKYKKLYGSVSSIYLRSNGVVHVNFKQKKNGYTYYTNVTFKLSGNTLKKPQVNSGSYKKKMTVTTVQSQSAASYKRSVIVNQAKKFLGYKESNGKHKIIIDLYNANRPWAANYKVSYSDAWCATFVSTVAIIAGYTDIIPTECSCRRMVELLQEMDSWEESDSYVPKKGDLIFYDWQDSGTGDNTGVPDHVGIVSSVSGNTITVIEGNYKNSVKTRKIKVNAKTIRGYGTPAYTS